MGKAGMGRDGLFHCIGKNMKDQRICVVPLFPPTKTDAQPDSEEITGF